MNGWTPERRARQSNLCPMFAKGCNVCRHVELGAVAKAEPTDSELKARLARAKAAIRPEVRAAFVISEFGGHPDVAGRSI